MATPAKELPVEKKRVVESDYDDDVEETEVPIEEGKLVVEKKPRLEDFGFKDLHYTIDPEWEIDETIMKGQYAGHSPLSAIIMCMFAPKSNLFPLCDKLLALARQKKGVNINSTDKCGLFYALVLDNRVSLIKERIVRTMIRAGLDLTKNNPFLQLDHPYHSKTPLDEVLELKPGLRVLLQSSNPIQSIPEYLTGGEKVLFEEISRLSEPLVLNNTDLKDRKKLEEWMYKHSPLLDRQNGLNHLITEYLEIPILCALFSSTERTQQFWNNVITLGKLCLEVRINEDKMRILCAPTERDVDVCEITDVDQADMGVGLYFRYRPFKLPEPPTDKNAPGWCSIQ